MSNESPINSSGELFTYRQVAERLRVCVKTVRNYVKAGRLRATEISEGVRRITERDYEAFVAACRG